LSAQHEMSDDSLSDVPKVPDELDSSDEVDSSAEVIPNSSKVSVIPHDLFYYPHYNVPISAVLNAYLEPHIESYDTGNNKDSSETVEDVLDEKNFAEHCYEEDEPVSDLEIKQGGVVPPSEVDTDNDEEETDIFSLMNSNSEKEVPLLVIEEVETEKDGNEAISHQDSPVPQHPEV
ncbi:CLMN protein, partial [Turnix velox]|nr:CLMN protein [Turnix velox]